MKKITPKQVRARTSIILGIGLLIALCGVDLEISAFSMVGLLIMFSSIIYHVIFYRCPHCGKFLDRNTGEFCPGCGKKVNEME